MSQSSGTGASYQADWLRCERYFFEKHRRGIVLAKNPDAMVAAAVGTALHEFKRAFYEAQMFDADITPHDAKLCGEDAFEKALAAETAEHVGIDFDDVLRDERAQFARNVLSARVSEIAQRLRSGVERTIACEQELTLNLTAEFEPRYVELPEELHTYTGRIDRIFEHDGSLPDTPAGIGIEDYKSTSANSPKQVASEMHMSDQHLGYAYLVDHKFYTPQPSAPMVAFARYTVYRLTKALTASSWHEEALEIEGDRLTDWYQRLIKQRLRMARQWEAPRDEWEARRYAHGPCIRFGRPCEYITLCQNPGAEERFIGEYGSAATYWEAKSDA